MKKALCSILLCSFFISCGAYADERCEDYNASPGEYVVRDKSRNYKVYKCQNDGKTNDLEEPKDIEFCSNANTCLLGMPVSITAKDNRSLCINKNVYKDTIHKNGINYLLSDFAGKSDACYFCPEGYQFDMEDQECEEAHAQSCTQLVANKCKDDDRYLTEDGGHGCYVCDQKENGTCSNGNRVFMAVGYLGSGTEKKMNQIWSCNAAQKTWTPRSIGVCPGSKDLSGEYQAGRALAPVIENPDRSSSHNNASSFIIINTEPCIRWSCDASKGYKEINGKCVFDSDYKAYCTKNGGDYQDGKCMCKDVLGLEPTDNNRTCKCTKGNDFVWDANKRECVKSVAAVARDEKAQRQEQDRQSAIANARNKCEKSGGSYNGKNCICDSGKGLMLSGGECFCNGGYEWVNPSNKKQGCKKMSETLYKEKCLKEPNATWNDLSKQCICNNADYTFNTNVEKCEPSAEYSMCQKLVQQGVASWNAFTKVCSCIKPGFVISGGECVETEEAKNIRMTEEATQAVNSVYNQLTLIHDKFRDDVTVWKNAEGKFNTARLASDSIAGVVLGTAGGLITSNVVKKNQVEDGFEDLRCTIGGQEVANWGDQFRVGIQ